jgi:hypothetical protein
MRKYLTRRKAAGIAAALTLTSALAGPPPAGAAVTPTAAVTAALAGRALTPVEIRMVGFIASTMRTLRKEAPRGAAPGTWKGSGDCFRCDAGPALALAASAYLTHDVSQRRWAKHILDEEIRRHQQENGAFGNAPGGPDLDTMFFANTLGFSALLLKPQMGKPRYTRWTAAVTGAADYLIGNGNLSWYTNGNIVLGNALTMALAYRLSGDTKYKDAYETALDFAVSPPPRWAGRGLIYTKKGTRADGRDSKGYFTEQAGPNIGYDPDYTQVQLATLAPLYLLTHDQRVLSYLNALTNQLDGRVNKRTWLFDTSGGTRHPQKHRSIPYDAGSLALLANVGGRRDLRGYLEPQARMFTRAYASGEGDRLRAAFGWTAATVIMSQPGRSLPS